jgi:hypothetical protein
MNTLPYIPGEPFELNHKSPQALGLVSWWPPIGSIGQSDLIDFVGVNRAVGAGSMSWQADREIDFCPVYNGSNTRFDCGAPDPFNALSAATFCAWVKWGGAANGLTAAQDVLRKDGCFAFGGGWAAGKARLWTWSSTNVLTAGPDSVSRIDDGNPHLVCAVLDGAYNTIYIDGRAEASAAYSSTLYSNTNHLFISSNGGGGEFWNGLIGDARIYRRGLSPAEIWGLYDPQTRWDLYKSPRGDVIYKQLVSPAMRWWRGA